MSNETNALLTRPSLRRVLVAALLLITFLASFAGGARSAVAETEPTTPSPTPSPPDAELAAKLARDGEYEAAIGAYLAVIAQGEPLERLPARLALARVYLDDGQSGAAASQLDAYLLEAPAANDVRPAQYLLAEALAGQDDWAGALPLYEAYVEAGGGAAGYARLSQAEGLAHLGRGAEADEAGQRALEDVLPQSVRTSFELRMAQALEELFPNESRGWYERLLNDSQSPADQALALWRSFVIERGLGHGEAWLDTWRAIIQRFPATATAQAIVDDPPPIKGAGILLDAYYVGLVYYRAGRDADARERFEVSLDANQQGGDPSLAARSSFYLAVLDERAGATSAAIEGYARVVALDPRVELADDALWWQARLLEEAGRVGEATTVYQRLGAEYGDTDWGAEARLRAGLLTLDAGRPADAARAFAGIAAQAQDEERQRALLWQGKALAEAGDGAGAQAVWRSLRDEAIDDYYGLRAGVLMGETGGALEDAGLDDDEAPPDWAAIETWPEDAADVDASAGLEALWFNSHWGLGQELLAIGAHHQASSEFGALLEDAGRDPAVLYQLAHFYHSLGVTDLAARAAARLLGAVPEDAAEAAPADLWRVAYPAPYADLFREASNEGEVPDVLMLAMVRQESFFDPRAGSSAGALGLTQVIPLTGGAIASELAIGDFEIEHLFRPGVSLRFGAHYLGQQLDAFDGNLYHALAAYNGGPGNAERWADAADGDVDRFVEEISFAQTKLYVKLVAENLARYRQLYQNLDAPQLPQDD